MTWRETLRPTMNTASFRAALTSAGFVCSNPVQRIKGAYKTRVRVGSVMVAVWFIGGAWFALADANGALNPQTASDPATALRMAWPF